MKRAADAGDTTRTDGVAASGAGRRAETAVRREVAEVSEVTRTGVVARTTRSLVNRVPSPVEQPVPREDDAEKGRGESRTERPALPGCP